MDFNEYFAARNELAMRVLIELPEASVEPIDRRLVWLGSGLLFAAIGVQVWASKALPDPGYFARTVTFLEWTVLASVFILLGAIVANAWLSRGKALTRETLKERTVMRMIDADRSVAQKLAVRGAGEG